ncbi:MAG TPA: hypothetical protein VES73_15195, partial [Lamprocystis sp. (in: g-proteobacteria)]|nr:hypothetical protein [Lamprocystis sp. (in: g-proteobacteria)]
EIGVPPQRVSAIVSGKRAITADTDLRLCRFFGLSKRVSLLPIISAWANRKADFGPGDCPPLDDLGAAGYHRYERSVTGRLSE